MHLIMQAATDGHCTAPHPSQLRATRLCHSVCHAALRRCLHSPSSHVGSRLAGPKYDTADILVVQQGAGAEAHVVFRGDVPPGGCVRWISRRAEGFPFGVTVPASPRTRSRADQHQWQPRGALVRVLRVSPRARRGAGRATCGVGGCVRRGRPAVH